MVGLSLLVLGGLSFLFSVFLSFAARRLTVVEDPLIARIEELLPGTNCGACGFAGCHAVAELLAARRLEPDSCVVGGKETAEKIGKLLGVFVSTGERRVAAIHCQGGRDKVADRFIYVGIKTCLTAHNTAGGPKACIYGCLGFGDCVRVCPFGAIKMGKNGLPVIEESLCVACGKCVAACPRKIITLIPRKQWTYVACVSRDRGKRVQEVCPVGCIACELCARVTKSGAIRMEDNLPRLDINIGQDFQEAVERCPRHCFVVRLQTSSAGGSEPKAGA